ncbi:class III lanthipeptide [Janthinobacterium fluminis]
MKRVLNLQRMALDINELTAVSLTSSGSDCCKNDPT